MESTVRRHGNDAISTGLKCRVVARNRNASRIPEYKSDLSIRIPRKNILSIRKLATLGKDAAIKWTQTCNQLNKMNSISGTVQVDQTVRPLRAVSQTTQVILNGNATASLNNSSNTGDRILRSNVTAFGMTKCKMNCKPTADNNSKISSAGRDRD